MSGYHPLDGRERHPALGTPPPVSCDVLRLVFVTRDGPLPARRRPLERSHALVNNNARCERDDAQRPGDPGLHL
jgi:hypothetical protein